MFVDLPPLVAEAVKRLPPPGAPFPEKDRVRWAELVNLALKWDYGFLDVDAAPSARPPAPPSPDKLAVFRAEKVIADPPPAPPRHEVVARPPAEALRPDVYGGPAVDDWACNRPLVDAADEPFVRRFAIPFSRGGLLKPGTLVLIGENGHHGPSPAEAPAGDPLPCPHCDRTFTSRQALGGHVSTAHNDDHVDHRCVCGLTFRRKVHYLAHRRACSGAPAAVDDQPPVALSVPQLEVIAAAGVHLEDHELAAAGVTRDQLPAPEGPPSSHEPDDTAQEVAVTNQEGPFRCEHCGTGFETRHQRAGHKRWCASRPGAAATPAHMTDDGDPVPTSVVPHDVVPQPGFGGVGAREAAARANFRKASVEEAGTDSRSFIESLRWRPKTDPAPGLGLGHKRRPEHDELVRMASVDSSVPRFKV